jgi:uncharacterized membrane protein YcfT
MVFTKHLGVLVASTVVLECNLGIMKEKGSKDKSVLALVKDKERLVIYYAFDVNLNVFAGSIKHLGIP